MSAPRKVVICYDESEVGRHVLEWVNGHSILLPTDEVTVVTAINEDLSKVEGSTGWTSMSVGIVDTIDFRQAIKDLERQGRQHLSEAVEAFHQVGIKKVKAVILKGPASTEIAKYAKEQNVDLVICGNRGLGFLKRKLIGSTSEYLVNHLNCTVMVVRGQKD